MKKIALLLITLLTTGTMLMAHNAPRRGEHRNMNIKQRAERMADRMTKEYSLNDTQKRQVYEANLVMIADMQPLQNQGHKAHKRSDSDKKKGTADRPSKEDREKMTKERKEKRMADMKQSREAYDAKLKSIFTKDQYEAYNKNKAERQKRMEERKASKPQSTNS